MTKLLRAPIRIRSCFMAFALMSGGAPVAFAQDATTTTPPELRDFRLDAPPADREPLPETTPPVTPAPSPEPSQSRPTPAPVVMPPPASTSPRTQASPSDNTPSTAVPAPVATQQTPEDPPERTAERQPIQAPPPMEAEPVQQEADASDDVIRIIGMIMLLVLAAAGGFYGYRRRTKAAPGPKYPAVRATAQSPTRPKTSSAPLKGASKPPAQPSPTLAPIGQPKAVVTSAPSPLSMTFVPDNAVVSLANLVVRGQLQVANSGPDIIHGMALRAVLIAASAQQQLAVESFFADPSRIQPSSAGTLHPGERIGLTLELTVALNEMQTFMLGDQTLLVPILLAHVSCDNAAPQQEARLVCMIGREASPPTPKMGPLRLDLGPRTFGRLGQRPLLA